MKSSVLTWLFALILIIAGCAVVMQSGVVSIPSAVEEKLPPPMNPEAQTERLTSHILVRKIEELRSRAVYLQHREEGKRLIMMGRGTEEEDNAKLQEEEAEEEASQESED